MDNVFYFKFFTLSLIIYQFTIMLKLNKVSSTEHKFTMFQIQICQRKKTMKSS